jgi:hypothetical protein
MSNSDSFLDISIVNLELHRRHFQYPSSKGQILEFNDIAEWRDYLDSCRIRSRRVHPIYDSQFCVALRTMLFAWVDASMIKVAEMAALRALESSLQYNYYQPLLAANPPRKKKPTEQQGQLPPPEPTRFGLAMYLDYAERHDGLSTVYPFATFKENANALNRIRNGLTHGDIFSGFPWGGLLETVREIIEHAWRKSPEWPEASLCDNGVAEMGQPE